MKPDNTIPVRQPAGRCRRSILAICFLFLLSAGLQAQSVTTNPASPGSMGDAAAMPSVPESLGSLHGMSESDAGRIIGLRSLSPFAEPRLTRKKHTGAITGLTDPIDAREGMDVAIAFMADEDPDARPVNLYGEDSSLFEDHFFKQTTEQDVVVPTGKSHFWEAAFLNDADSLVHFALVVGGEVVEYEAIDIRDFPPQELPPIPLSELKSIPDDFINSQSALATALTNGLDDLLQITRLDGWFALDYNLGGFFFDYPGLLDSESPVFWDLLFDGHAWDDDGEQSVWVESNFLIDGITGNLLAKLVFTSEDDLESVEFLSAYSRISDEMLDTNEDAALIQAFGQENLALPSMPSGKSEEWMAVWFDFDEEFVYMFLTRGGEIYSRNYFPLSDIPEEDRPPPGHFRPIGIQYGSEHALTTSLDAGLRQQLEQAPPDAESRINYNLHSGYTMFPDILDEDSNPFWHLEVSIEVFNEQWERVYHQFYNYLVDAVTGAFLGAVTETSAEGGLELPDRMELHQNYPNPFNPETRILWELNAEQHVTLTVYDLLGRKVAQLADGVHQAGVHSVTFDASALSSGVYIYRLEAGGTVLNRKMTVVK